MLKVRQSTVIDAPIERVWAVLRRFNGHVDWHPAIAASHIEQDWPDDRVGCVRAFTLTDGGRLREQLLAHSDAERSFTYCILESSVPLLRYVATVRLHRVTDGERTVWEWSSRFSTPPGREAALKDLVARGVYQAGFEGLRRYLAQGPQTAQPPPATVVPDAASTTRTRAMVLAAHGGTEGFVAAEHELPPPAPGEVRVRHEAVGLNFLDIYLRRAAGPLFTAPGVLGVEAAGRVTAVGAQVQGLAVGDAVVYCTLPPGAYCVERNLSAAAVVRRPHWLSADAAAAVFLKGLTAEYLLHRLRPVQRGDAVLVHAAAGGVGQLACAWARDLGARVIGVVGAREKRAVAQQAGCEHVLVRGDGDLAAEVIGLTGGYGADLVLDGVGGPGVSDSLAALAPCGHLALFGHAAGPIPPLAHGVLEAKSASVSAPVVFAYTADRARLEAMSRRLFAALERGAIRAAVGQRFALADVAAAHEALESGRTQGSVVLVP